MQSAAEGVAKLLGLGVLGHLDEEPADVRAGEAGPEESCEKEERDRDEREEGDEVEEVGSRCRERVGHPLRCEGEHRRGAAEEHGAEHAAAGRARRVPAAREQYDRGSGEEGAGRIPGDVQRAVRGVAVRHEDRVVRAPASTAARRRVDEQRGDVRQQCEDVGGGDERHLHPAPQYTGRVGEQRLQEHRDHDGLE